MLIVSYQTTNIISPLTKQGGRPAIPAVSSPAVDIQRLSALRRLKASDTNAEGSSSLESHHGRRADPTPDLSAPPDLQVDVALPDVGLPSRHRLRTLFRICARRVVAGRRCLRTERLRECTVVL